jgi:hypothetical protein
VFYICCCNRFGPLVSFLIHLTVHASRPRSTHFLIISLSPHTPPPSLEWCEYCMRERAARVSELVRAYAAHRPLHPQVSIKPLPSGRTSVLVSYAVTQWRSASTSFIASVLNKNPPPRYSTPSPVAYKSMLRKRAHAAGLLVPPERSAVKYIGISCV